MFRLCDRQQSLVKRVLSIYSQDMNHLARPPSLLLTGPSGSGKRTIARCAAVELGMDFIEIKVDGGSVGNVRETLFGTACPAHSLIADDRAPGEAGRDAPSMLYLTGLENIDASLIAALVRLLSRGRYVDATGKEWSVSDSLWVVGGLVFAVKDPTVTSESFLSTYFHYRLSITTPHERDDLIVILESMLWVSDCKTMVDFSAGNVAEIVAQTSDGLHALRRWVESIAAEGESGRPIGENELRRAMLEDMKWLLQRIPYRGRELTLDHVGKWVAQFPREIQSLATLLVRRISAHYYMSQQKYHDALADLILRSGIHRGSPVVFCRWQSLGGSADRVANIIKNQAQWRTKHEVDLRQPPKLWPRIPPQEAKFFVLADDFVGTGETLSSLFPPKTQSIRHLLEQYPDAQVYVLIIVGFERGLRNVRDLMTKLQKRVKILVAEMLSEKDTCFHPESRVIDSVVQQVKLRDFCIEAAKQHMPSLKSDFWLGYKDTAAVFVFHDSVPNNSLPILWHSDGSWHPLFPRSGVPS